MAEADTKFCSNCKRHIASVNYVMHEVHCKRNIVLCEHCEEPVPHSELDEHYDEYHAPAKCPQCGQQIEKAVLELHQKEECPKRGSKCDFCELELPFSELSSHKEYCGSRTEQCPLCSQYIMQKDQIKHEESMCSYPPPKNNTSSQNNHRALLNGDSHPHSDAFRLDELSRILNDPSMSQPARPAIQATLSRHRNQLGLHRSSRTAPPKQINSRPVRQTGAGPNQSRTKRTNEVASQRQRAAKEKNHSFNRPQNHSNDQDSGDDLDRLLAMHLAQDLHNNHGNGHDVNSDHEVNHFDDFPSHRRRSSSSPTALHGEAITLPCEFCGDPFPMELLISHQSHCNQPNSSEDTMGEVEQSSPIMQPNNSPLGMPRSRHGQPHIVDNLSYLAAQNWLSQPGQQQDTTEDGEVMLPCEFCDQPFPEDILVQHQAVCEVSGTQSPTLPRNVARRQTRAMASAAAAAQETKPSRVAKRQNDPSFNFHFDIADGAASSSVSSSAGIQRKTVVKKKTTNLARDGSSNNYARRNISARTSSRTGSGRMSGTSSNDFNTRSNKYVHPDPPLPTRLVTSSNNDNRTFENSQRGRTQRRHRDATGSSRRQPDLDQMLENPSITTADLLSNLTQLDKETKSQRNQRQKECSTDDFEQNGLEFGAVADARSGSHGSGRPINPETTQETSYNSNYPVRRTSTKSRSTTRRVNDFEGDRSLAPRVVQPSDATAPSTVSSRRRANNRPSSRSRRYPQGDL